MASAPLGVPVAAVGAFASCGGALSVAASVDAFDSTAMLRLHWHCGRVSQPGPYRYYADFSNALHNHTAVRDCMPADRAAHRCVIVLGHTCTTTYHDLERQVGRMLPVVSAARMERRRLVVAVFLNKVYHNLTGKLSLLSRLESAGGGNVSIATFSWSPIVGQRPAQGKMSFHFMPFATNAVVHSAVARADKYDLYWSGDTNPDKYALRQVLVGNLVALQQRHALRIYTPGEHLPDASYFATLAASRLVLSTPLREWHIVGTRYFEVMASGRAVLLCYREASAYSPLGIIEDTHVVMFGSPKEFEQKLLLYSNATESAVARATRRRIALNARQLVAHRHTWRHRATQVVKVLCALRVCEHRQNISKLAQNRRCNAWAFYRAVNAVRPCYLLYLSTTN